MKKNSIHKNEIFFSAKQSGKLKNSVTPWPPFRPPTPVSNQYDDPRVVLGSKVFHAMIFVILYKAINGQNISEHVMSLAVYLLEMAVETAEVPDKSVRYSFKQHTYFSCILLIKNKQKF